MNNLKTFANESFGLIRVLKRNNEMWLVGKDVAECLGYSRPDHAINKHVDNEDKLMYQIDTSGQNRNMFIINESGLYSLILGSKLTKAKEFKRWVTKEVLPSIRQNGGYIANQSNLSEAELLAQAVLVAQNVIANQKKQLEQIQHKADFFDAVTESEDTFDMTTVCKVLNWKGIGRNKLFCILREEHVLMQNNQPYQQYIDRGWFRVIESKFVKPNGDICMNTKTVVYQKGVDGILKVLKRKYEVETA